MSKNVLITGGGLVGTNTAIKFAEEGHNVFIYDIKPVWVDLMYPFKEKIKLLKGNILDIEYLSKIVRKNSIEGIIHTAAIADAFEANAAGAYTTFKVNVEGTLNVLEVARKEGLRRVIYTSTGAVYGERKDLKPIKETDPLNPIGIYPYTKYMGEKVVEMYRKFCGVDAIIVRLSHVYGMGYTKRRHLMEIAVWNVLEGREVKEEAGGDYSANYTFVKDVAEGLFILYSANKTKYEVYNLGEERNYTLFEVAEAVQKAIPESRIKIGPGLGRWPERALLRGPMDMTRMKEEFNFKFSWTLEEAVKEYAKWVKKQIDSKKY